MNWLIIINPFYIINEFLDRTIEQCDFQLNLRTVIINVSLTASFFISYICDLMYLCILQCLFHCVINHNSFFYFILKLDLIWL